MSEEEIKSALSLDVSVDYGMGDDSDVVEIKLKWNDEVIDSVSFCLS